MIFNANAGDRTIEPRATRIPLPHRPELRSEIWMGGTDSVLGEPLTEAGAADAIVIDCCGDLPHEFRRGSGRYVPLVFMDAEVRPFAYAKLAALAEELAGVVLAGADVAPHRIYVLCQYGMNRSGLLTGLLLRALGEGPQQAVELIRRLRPGSLSNHTFVSLIEGWRRPESGDG